MVAASVETSKGAAPRQCAPNGQPSGSFSQIFADVWNLVYMPVPPSLHVEPRDWSHKESFLALVDPQRVPLLCRCRGDLSRKAGLSLQQTGPHMLQVRPNVGKSSSALHFSATSLPSTIPHWAAVISDRNSILFPSADTFGDQCRFEKFERCKMDGTHRSQEGASGGGLTPISQVVVRDGSALV